MGRYLELLEKEAANRAGKGGPKVRQKGDQRVPLSIIIHLRSLWSPGPPSQLAERTKKKTRPLVVRSTQIKLNYIMISMT